MSSVNKCKIPLEPAKQINEKVRKLLHQAVGHVKVLQKTELGIRKSKALESSSAKTI